MDGRKEGTLRWKDLSGGEGRGEGRGQQGKSQPQNVGTTIAQEGTVSLLLCEEIIKHCFEMN